MISIIVYPYMYIYMPTKCLSFFSNMYNLMAKEILLFSPMLKCMIEILQSQQDHRVLKTCSVRI